MNPEELKAMQKAVRRARRITTEKACELHELEENRLSGACEEIQEVAQETYDTCKAREEADAAFKAAEAGTN